MVKIIQNYTIHEQIGEGEYGKVYRAIDNRTSKQVAVKVILARKFKQNPKLEECTLNQIQVLSKIDSPHIVKFIEILKTVNNFYFFYQYCNGGTLDQEIHKNGFLRQPKILDYMEQLLEAFRVLTASNIMHRDLKPSNIMIHNGKLKLGDFGFCKSLESQRDLAQTMLGSPIYMAPEVLRGEIYTIKADIWSLGVVIYQMAYGFCPYEESSIAKLIGLQQHQKLQFNRDINPISPVLQDFLRKVLVKDHFKRISWDDLLSYNFKNGKLVQSHQQLTHYRTLTETNRAHKLQSDIFQQQQNKPPLDTKNFKKKNKQQQQLNTAEIHSWLLQIVQTIDKLINDNQYPEIIFAFALKIYKLVFKEHSKLGSKKQYQKERAQLNQAVNQIQALVLQQKPIQEAYLISFLRGKKDFNTGIQKLLKVIQKIEPNLGQSSFNNKNIQKIFQEIRLKNNL